MSTTDRPTNPRDLLDEVVRAAEGLGPHAGGDNSYLVDNADCDDLRSALMLAANRIARAERWCVSYSPELGLHYPMDVHTWFNLTYANYLVLHRTLMQSMPEEWQHRFVFCLNELHEAFPDLDEPRYTVHARDHEGRFVEDPVPHYNRGRTHLAPRIPEPADA